MQKHLRNMILGVGSFIVFIVAAMLILSVASRNINFDYDVYQEQLANYKKQDPTFEESKQAVNDYIAFVLNHETPEKINESIYDILPEVDLNISYVGCSDKQLREYALDVFAAGQEYFGLEDVKMLESVYAIEERVALFTESPRSYLYFILTEDQESMVAFIMTPTADGASSIEPLWNLEQAADSEYVIAETNRYRFIYTNQVF